MLLPNDVYHKLSALHSNASLHNNLRSMVESFTFWIDEMERFLTSKPLCFWCIRTNNRLSTFFLTILSFCWIFIWRSLTIVWFKRSFLNSWETYKLKQEKFELQKTGVKAVKYAKVIQNKYMVLCGFRFFHHLRCIFVRSLLIYYQRERVAFSDVMKWNYNKTLLFPFINRMRFHLSSFIAVVSSRWLSSVLESFKTKCLEYIHLGRRAVLSKIS